MQAAVGVFLSDRDDEAKVGLDHFLLGLTRLALALLHRLDDAAVLGNFEAGFRRELVNLGADVFDLRPLGLDELAPFLAVAGDAVEPRLVEFVAVVFVDEVLARHAVAVGKTHQAAFEADQALVDRVKLFDEALDAVVVERQRFHVDDDLVADFLVSLLLLARALVADELLLELLVLLLAELLVGRRDLVERLEDFRFQLGFHRSERHRVLELIVVIAFAFRRARGTLISSRLLRLGRIFRCGFLNLFRFRPFVGRFEIDDVAKQNLAFVEFVAPDDDGLERQRAFAEARDHGFTAGLDALRNGDFAFARQEFDGTHLAQVHAHGIVGALGGLGLRFAFDEGVVLRDQRAAFLFVAALFTAFGGFFTVLVLDDGDAHVGERRVQVLDLVGRNLFRRQHRVQLIECHIALGLRRLQKAFDRLVGKVEQGAVALGRVGCRLLFLFRFLSCLLGACHSAVLVYRPF